MTRGKQGKESKLQIFPADCDREAGWSKHLFYSLPAFVCTYLILLSCSAAVSSWVKRLQAFTANIKHWIKSWTCLTDWLLSSLLHLLSSPVSSPFTAACPVTHKVSEFLLLFQSDPLSLLGLVPHSFCACSCVCVIYQTEASTWKCALLSEWTFILQKATALHSAFIWFLLFLSAIRQVQLITTRTTHMAAATTSSPK